jgi:hypothetical protein
MNGRKKRLIKYHITRQIELTRDQIKTPIPFMVGAKSKKNALFAFKGKFMRSIRMEEWVNMHTQKLK